MFYYLSDYAYWAFLQISTGAAQSSVMNEEERAREGFQQSKRVVHSEGTVALSRGGFMFT